MFDDVNNSAATSTPATPPAPAPTPVAPGTATGSAEEIHTMPMDYYTGGKTANIAQAAQPIMAPSSQMSAAPGGKKKILNIIIVAVLVLVVGVSSYLLYASYKKPANNQPVVVNDQPVVEQPVVEQPVVEQPANPDEVTAPPVDIPVEPVVEPLKFDPSKLSVVSLTLMASIDKDKDGLTDAEEAVIGSDANLNDTDKDTYTDGAEMKNFYDPLKAAIRLNESVFVANYENPNYGYKLIYPKTWMASPLNASDPKELMFTSKGNEFVSIFVDKKGLNQTLDAWYLEKAPNITATQVKKYQNYKKLPVIESPDGFTAYIASNDKVYILNYNIGLNEEANFPGLFGMLVNSFELMPVVAAPVPFADFLGIMKSLNVKDIVDNNKVIADFACGSRDCFYDAFGSCTASLAVLRITDNLTYEVSVNGKEGTDCFYSARFTKISDAAWAGKTMKCKYDPEHGVETSLKLVENCTGDLASLIKPQQP